MEMLSAGAPMSNGVSAARRREGGETARCVDGHGGWWVLGRRWVSEVRVTRRGVVCSRGKRDVEGRPPLTSGPEVLEASVVRRMVVRVRDAYDATC